MMVCLLTGSAVCAQTASISGPACVPKGSTIYYTYVCYFPSSGSYSISGGVDFNGHTSGSCPAGTNSVYVIWNSTTVSGSVSIPGKTLNVNMYTPLIPGTIATPFPNINFNSVPPTYSCSAATGGYCSPVFSYQWQSSTDGTNFSDISGATGQNLSFSTGLLTTTSYRRRVTETGSGTVGYSNVGKVTILNQLMPGSVTPGTQTINYGTNPAMLSSTGVSGGNGTYGYQWQSSPDNSTWTNVSGATSGTYTPPALTATAYFRVAVTSNGGTLYSSSAIVQVYPLLPVVPGAVTPASQTVNYNTVPGLLTSTGVSGGNNIYSYQWQSSPDNATWTNVNGTAATYTPPASTVAMYYRVAVTSSYLTAYSSPALVDVYPQLLPGSIAPVNIVIAPGSSPGRLGGTPAFGGGCSGSYAYQWLTSSNGTAFTAISGATGATYIPPALSSNAWYCRQVSCNGISVNSDTVWILISSAIPDMNYLRIKEIKKSGVTDDAGVQALTSPYDVGLTTQYYDGLGRLVQTVDQQQSPLLKDAVSLNAYDRFGREMYRYLPYVATTSDGNYKPTAQGDQYAYNALRYPSEQNFFNVDAYEQSPLGRINASYAPGISWSGSGRSVSMQYLVNTATDSVAIWSIGYTAGSLPTMSGRYPAGTLYKSVTIDEINRAVVEYKNFDGQVVLKKAQLADNPGSAHAGWLCTYYVYDNIGNLRFVMQPRATELINNTSGNWVVTQPVADELCSRYEYDARNRLIVKKIPGAGEVWMVYDVRDRLVMTQDALQRSQQKWLVTVYDSRNRPDSTGLIIDPLNYNNLSYHLNLAAASTSYPNLTNYTTEVLTGIYYDDYSWAASFNAMPSLGTVWQGQLDTASHTPPYALTPAPYMITRGKTTGSMTKVLGTGNYLYTLNYYDDRGRLIQKQGTNYTGGVDTLTTQYNFTGQVLRTILNHQKAGNTVQHHDVVTKMTYDAGLRLRSIWKSIDAAGTYFLIDSMQYDEMGQLRAKYFGGGIDSMIYDYNIRGWQTGINKEYVGGGTSHYFGQELNYDNTASAVPGSGYAAAQYTGSIAGLTWKTRGDSTKRKYDFTYDNVRRLTGATFNQNTGGGWSTSLVNYTVNNISYDANGNIMTMNQQGFKWNGSALIDQLSYSYLPASNKLSQVGDAANDPLSQLGDFHFNGTKQSTDYSYDANGSLVSDNNKAIDKIVYNYRNLPELIHVNGKGNITCTYDAAGNKLSRVVVDSLSRHLTTTLYLNGFVYQHSDTITTLTPGVDTLQFVLHEEGRARWALHYYQNGTKAYGWEGDFFEKDHLGNTRMVLTTQRDTATYLATMEGAYRTKENALFYNIPQSVYSRVLAGYPVDLSTTNPNDSVIALNGTVGRTQGPAIILKVMAGDIVSVGAKCYYNSQSSGQRNTAINDLLASLANGVVGLTGGGKGSLTQLNTPGAGPLYGALNSFITNKEDSILNKPRAYLSYMFLDGQYQFDAGKSGALAVGNYAAGTLNSMAQSNIVVGKNGYLYVWVSNETQGWPVFFDNLSVQVQSGPILEETHYYPFGLTMAGISDKALKPGTPENKYKYNGYEENKAFDVDLYESSYRTHDPQLGRFWQMDPKIDRSGSWTPYAAMSDNPIKYADPLGDTAAWFRPDGSFWKFVDDGKKTWSGVFFQRSTVLCTYEKNGVQYEVKQYSDGKTFQFNDAATAIQGIRNGVINRVEFGTDAMIDKAMNISGVKGVTRDKGMNYAWHQGVAGGKMDYGIAGISRGDFNKNTLYVRDGLAYDVADWGNFLFGRGMAYLEIDLGTVQIGAHYNNFVNGRVRRNDATDYYNFGPGTYGSPGIFDSPSDQQAIINGYTSHPDYKNILKRYYESFPKYNGPH